MSQLPPSRHLPCLLAGINPSLLKDPFSLSDAIPPRPRALWNVSDDTSIRPLSPFAVLNPRNSTFVSDAPPSVVAIRIAECLRRWSTCTEYDNDNATATVLTADRCLFGIQLYQGKKNSRVDYSYGTIVECSLLRGSVIVFHRIQQAVLKAAMSESNGSDQRPLRQVSVYDFKRMYPHESATINRRGPAESPTELNLPQGLEDAHALLNKDRLDAQISGMERLLAMTDTTICGIQPAVWMSRACLHDHPEVCSYLAHLVQNHDANVEGLYPRHYHKSHISLTSAGGALSVLCPSPVLHQDVRSCLDPEEALAHHGHMRSMALRIVANSLWTLYQNSPHVLSGILSDSPWSSPDTLVVLGLDLQHGPHRPPSIVLQGLAGPHECVYVLRILRVLALFRPDVRGSLPHDPNVGHCQTVGASTHECLETEARAVYYLVTEEERSC